MQRPSYQQIGLGPLRGTPVQRLLQSLLGDDPSVVELGKQIASRAQGNPFFLEELVRSIADWGTLDGEVGAYRLKDNFDMAPLPQTVQAVIAARIDRLDRRAKEVLQTASVIGRDVPLAVLETVVGPPASEVNESLSHLRDADLFHELPPFDQGVFGFRHPLIQEVAYESLLQSKRRELHAAVASAIETVFKDRLQERSGLLALHYEQAGEFFKAAQSYMSAAVWVGATDSKQALRCWKKIPTLLDKAQPNQSTDYLRMMANGQIINFGWREGMPANEGLKYFEEARRAATAARDVHAIALIHAAYGRLLGATGSADDYVEKIREAEARAAEFKNASLQVTLKAVLCHALRLAGRMSDAIVVNTEASADAHNIGKFDRQMLGFDIGPWLIAMRGQTLVMLGRSVEARQYLDQVLQMDPAAIDAIYYAVPSFGYMDLAFCENDPGLARLHAERLAKLAGDSGIPYLRTYADAYAGLSSINSGQLDDGIAQLGQALAFARKRRAGLENEARILADVANAYRLKGDLEAAKQWALELIAVATERHCRAPECFARIVLAEILCGSASATDRLSAEMEAEKISQLMAATGLLIYQKLFDGLKAKLAAFNDQAGYDGLRSKQSEPGRISEVQELEPSHFNINVEGPASKDPKANLGST